MVRSQVCMVVGWAIAAVLFALYAYAAYTNVKGIHLEMSQSLALAWLGIMTIAEVIVYIDMRWLENA